ncbi:Rieske (2Fe-2S) protein [Nocardioides sp. zg-DK7169]|uniref:Rieske (2Fe-2S) protein n=1 Tax=Nocardioides sp. zg-DK7169 TaxID=2736600 RepID=UPI0015523CA0|nr:Rieske (2Fe-2S) protein [Nocardioides sp. zg-DK7169]NPC96278.1 Rieske (2Fe-2S) protein [Nocardioides sp. zg-DK7169]
MTHSCSGPCFDRRGALTAAAVAGVGIPFLAACGNDSSGDVAVDTGPAGTSLTTTGSVPVGGGTIIDEEKVVVVQPREGEFKAWSSICTHQGCSVTAVEDGEIICRCHSSHFSIDDGAPVSGPASTPLPEVAIKVSGEDVQLA